MFPGFLMVFDGFLEFPRLRNPWKLKCPNTDDGPPFVVLWREGSVSNFRLSGGGPVILQKGMRKLPKHRCGLELESNSDP